MKRKRKMTALAAALLSAVLLSITGTAYAGPADEAAGAVKTAAGAQAGGSAQAQEAAAQETGKVYTIRPPQSREEVEKDILSVAPTPADLEDLKARISATETAKKTRQIILINDGRIEATGTQEELLQSSDLYRSMWQAHIAAKEDEDNA